MLTPDNMHNKYSKTGLSSTNHIALFLSFLLYRVFRCSNEQSYTIGCIKRDKMVNVKDAWKHFHNVTFHFNPARWVAALCIYTVVVTYYPVSLSQCTVFPHDIAQIVNIYTNLLSPVYDCCICMCLTVMMTLISQNSPDSKQL